VPEPSAIHFEMTFEKLKILTSPVIDQILAELLRAVCKTFRSEIYKLLIRFGIRMNCLRCGRSGSLYLIIRRAIKQIVVII
jgi:hypothetical protein